MLQMIADVHAISRRRSTWRPEHLSGFEGQWNQTMPVEGRINLQSRRSKYGLEVEELRLVSATYEDVRWSNSNMTTSVVLMHGFFNLTSPPAYSYRRSPIALIGIHAIARRYERACDFSDEIILSEIARLAALAPHIIGSEGEKFSLDCPCGRWLGKVDTVGAPGGPSQNILHVQTFVPPVARSRSESR